MKKSIHKWLMKIIPNLFFIKQQFVLIFRPVNVDNDTYLRLLLIMFLFVFLDVQCAGQYGEAVAVSWRHLSGTHIGYRRTHEDGTKQRWGFFHNCLVSTEQYSVQYDLPDCNSSQGQNYQYCWMRIIVKQYRTFLILLECMYVSFLTTFANNEKYETIKKPKHMPQSVYICMYVCIFLTTIANNEK